MPPVNDLLASLIRWDGGLTLLPPLVAIVLALMTRRVLPSLGIGVVIGGVVAAAGDPVAGAAVLAGTLFDVVTSVDNLTVTAFSVLVAAAVGVMGRSGGTRALVARVERLATGRRGTMIASWLAGAIVFFDDYANCLVVGSSMGPLCDRNRVSRAKLAYIVDSTAAPLASLAIISTWVGYEVGLIQEALVAGESAAAPFSVFLQALPYRSYCILTVIFVGVLAFTGRDFGPMRDAELAAWTDPLPEPEADGADAQSSAWLAALPVALLVAVTFGMLTVSGLRGSEAGTPMFEVLGNADPYRAMLTGAVVAWLAAATLAVSAGPLDGRGVLQASWGAARTVATPLLVLYLAWTLGSVMKEAGAAQVIASALEGRLSPMWLPAVTFLIAAATSFSIGSSFFTMGTLIPLVVPLALQLDGGAVGPILLASTAAVLDGAVLGDHASPLSDTTILSSLGSSVDVVTHVRTQLPYALLVGVVALLFGVIPAGFGWPAWLSVGVGAAVCGVAVWVLGRTPTQLTARAAPPPG